MPSSIWPGRCSCCASARSLAFRAPRWRAALSSATGRLACRRSRHALTRWIARSMQALQTRLYADIADQFRRAAPGSWRMSPQTRRSPKRHCSIAPAWRQLRESYRLTEGRPQTHRGTCQNRRAGRSRARHAPCCARWCQRWMWRFWRTTPARMPGQIAHALCRARPKAGAGPAAQPGGPLPAARTLGPAGAEKAAG